ncbi:hypothetical protein E2C01_096455 [Portunus trituberculatus]|uniref:Uncharacterized protein n=1 Tax=Portunus trituberculatus TaxID=210409 RepID=A0A5B7K6K3_PORTR|nr:hypothetical protein [Portunus trituberculatus]
MRNSVAMKAAQGEKGRFKSRLRIFMSVHQLSLRPGPDGWHHALDTNIRTDKDLPPPTPSLTKHYQVQFQMDQKGCDSASFTPR